MLRDPLIRSWRLIWEGFRFPFIDATASDFTNHTCSVTLSITRRFSFRHLAIISSAFWHVARRRVLFRGGIFRSMPHGLRKPTDDLISCGTYLGHPSGASSAVIYIAGRADPMAATFGFRGSFWPLPLARGEIGNGPVGLRRAFVFCQRVEQGDWPDLSAHLARACSDGAKTWTIVRRSRSDDCRFDCLSRFAATRRAYRTTAPTGTPLLVRPIITARAVSSMPV